MAPETDASEGHDPDESAEAADTYQALGRYVAKFSRLIWWMRSLAASTLTNGHAVGYVLGELALGEASAQQIANAYFAVSNYVGELTDVELAVSNALRKSVDATIKQRNDFAHGDWYIGWRRVYPDGTIPENSATAFVVRIKPARRSGHVEEVFLTPGDLTQIANGIVSLTSSVAEFGQLATKATNDPLAKALRVSDVFAMANGLVTRNRPRASEWPQRRYI